MRLTHFGIATALIFLTVIHVAVGPMLADHQSPVASYINLAIVILPVVALLLYVYLLLKSKAKKTQGSVIKPFAGSAGDRALNIAIGKGIMERAERASLAAIDKNSVAIMVEQAARIASIAELTARVDAASAVGDASQGAMRDALIHGTDAFKVNSGHVGTAAIASVSIKELMKQGEATPTADMALDHRRARLWAELQSPEPGCPAAIPSKMVIIGTGPANAACALAMETIAKRPDEKYLSAPLPIKRQGHGGARKRAKERRAGVAA